MIAVCQKCINMGVYNPGTQFGGAWLPAFDTPQYQNAFTLGFFVTNIG